MLKKIGLALLVALVGLAAVVASQPDTYTVERSATLPAPPEVVYGLVSDFHRWEEWSYWHTLDPQQKEGFEGAPSGVGAVHAWEGNEHAGKGKMTIVEATSPSAVRIQLEFAEPFESASTTDISLAPEAGGTRVTWKMTGHNNFVSKAFCLVMDMDAMLGADFEKNLANLAKVSEAEAKKVAEAEAAKKAAEEAARLAAEAAAQQPAEGAVAADSAQ